MKTFSLIEHFPLKQGLRHDGNFHITTFISLIEHFPLKQGLRLSSLRLLQHNAETLLEHLPLKQGLRLAFGKRYDFALYNNS